MVPVVSDSDCNKNYGGGFTGNMMCAGLLNEGGKGACQVRHQSFILNLFNSLGSAVSPAIPAQFF